MKKSNRPFKKHALKESHKKWKVAVKREDELYHRSDDIRTPFARDYNRILHCTAYRRLKNKTQVFFATSNDHVCTRIEHVNHVAAISHTICHSLGLNTELANAIALGHDLGHPPFGHTGERCLGGLAKDNLDFDFWHEKNSLHFVDNYETLEDPSGAHRNLNLTYAVRDGIVSHCGEIDENGIKPRKKNINLKDIEQATQYQPCNSFLCDAKIVVKSCG